MTEDEARQKWCPHVRQMLAASSQGLDGRFIVGWNRMSVYILRLMGLAEEGFQANPEECRCIASDCMAWRWLFRRIVVEPDDPQAESRIGHVKTDRGYCGLAGDCSELDHA